MRAFPRISTLIAVGVMTATTSAAPQYQIFDLGVVQMSNTSSYGLGVSPAGIAVGRSGNVSGGGQGFTWTQGGGLMGLPNLSGRDSSMANSANDNGIVVGTAFNGGFSGTNLPLIWQNGVVSQLPLPPDYATGAAWDVNASGVAVGSAGDAPSRRGVIYTVGGGTVITPTTSNGSYFSAAYAINDSGRIVGWGADPSDQFIRVGIIYDTSTNTTSSVGTFQGANSAIALGVNSNGQVVGYSNYYLDQGYPFIWTEGIGMVAVPLLAGKNQGMATGVNSAGWVVGTDSLDSSYTPFLYDGATTYRLADLLPPGSGWTLPNYNPSISDNGVIVGTGVHNSATRAFAMVPVPGTPTPTPTGTPTPTPAPITTHLVVSAPTGAYIGFSFSVMVSARDQFDNTAVGYTGTVHFTSTAGSASLPPNSTLTNGSAMFRASINSPGTHTITATDTNNGSITGTSNSIMMASEGSPTPPPPPTPTPSPSSTPTPSPTATPSPTPTPAATHFSISAPGAVTQYFPFNVTVTALDQFNNTATGYTGTVHFTSTSSGNGTHLPTDSTLANGTGIFSVMLGTPGNQTVTATDTTNLSLTGTSNPIFVNAKGSPTPTPPTTPTPPPATPTPTPSPSPTPPVTPTPSATPTPTLTPPPSATPTATPSATPAAQALNLSTRMRVLTGDSVGIGGFIITGTGSTHVLLRAIGPSLSSFGVPDALADPVLELHGPSPFVAITDDNWRDDPAQEALIIASGIQPGNDLESAIDATLVPGIYTAVISGKNNTSGVGLVEVYDLSQGAPAKLANISTRAFVSTGANVVIGGFFLGGGNTNDRIVVRGIGPSLTAQGVPNALADPVLEARDVNGGLLVLNNDWQDDPVQAAELIAAGLAPSNPLEAGIATTLPPGPYTVLLEGLHNGTGIGLVEVYDRGP